MSYNIDKNISYYPENSGLLLVASLDEDLSYAFNTILVFKDKKSRKLFYAYDNGCSCPTPFEDYYFTSAEDNNLNVLNKQSFHMFEDMVKNFPVSFDEKLGLITKMKRRIK